MTTISTSANLSSSTDSALVRAFGIFLGIATHLVFITTVVYLYDYLANGVQRRSPNWIVIDTLLALQFAIVHSLLLHPAVKRQLTRRWIKNEWYGLFFCLVTCAGLGLVFWAWQSSQTAIWELHGTARLGMRIAFWTSWAMLFYSLQLSGLGYQTGLTPWWYWLRKVAPPRRNFPTNSLYRILRHPIYLSFLGLIWFTPNMTLDHALLTSVWTIYIFVGSYLKDERLAFYSGNAYRIYQSQVSGYPFFPGRLGRIVRSNSDQDVTMPKSLVVNSSPSIRKAA
ncbi:MAG: hypothetical protein KDA87_23355 [Planctomycetales bacterium]|nr:hypothetical protein [Planctomycetales bacterium]